MMEKEKELGVVVATVEDDSIVEAGCLVVDGEMTVGTLETLRQLDIRVSLYLNRRL